MANKASADTWVDSRSAVAADFDAYAAAMVRAQASLENRATPATPALNSTTHAQGELNETK